MFAAACYLAAATLIGAAIATVYWRARFAHSAAAIVRLIADRDRHAQRAQTWRDEANAHARELQRVRAQVPKRDPKTHKFVKASVQ
jgi:hypothetical protein